MQQWITTNSVSASTSTAAFPGPTSCLRNCGRGHSLPRLVSWIAGRGGGGEEGASFAIKKITPSSAPSHANKTSVVSGTREGLGDTNIKVEPPNSKWFPLLACLRLLRKLSRGCRSRSPNPKNINTSAGLTQPGSVCSVRRRRRHCG